MREFVFIHCITMELKIVRNLLSANEICAYKRTTNEMRNDSSISIKGKKKIIVRSFSF